MRILTIWLVMVISSLFPVFASMTLNEAISSPQAPQVLVKISPIYQGQQLFISYDKGKIWQQITWFRDEYEMSQRQVINFEWSSDGWLMIVATKTANVENIENNNVNCLGVFNPTTKIIYWLAGFYTQPKDKTDIIEDINWSKPNEISYKLTHENESITYTKQITLTPEVLAGLKQDVVPIIINFGYKLGYAKDFAEVNTLLQQFGPDTRPAAKKYFKSYWKYFKLGGTGPYAYPSEFKNTIMAGFLVKDWEKVWKNYHVDVYPFDIEYDFVKKTFSFRT